MAYPADRFDDVPEYTDQHGAHREAFAAGAAGASSMTSCSCSTTRRASLSAW